MERTQSPQDMKTKNKRRPRKRTGRRSRGQVSHRVQELSCLLLETLWRAALPPSTTRALRPRVLPPYPLEQRCQLLWCSLPHQRGPSPQWRVHRGAPHPPQLPSCRPWPEPLPGPTCVQAVGGWQSCCSSWAMQSGMNAASRAGCASANACTCTRGVRLDDTNQRQQLG